MNGLDLQHVMDAVDSSFFSTSARQEYNEVKSQLWAEIDNHINLADCEIYRQVPFGSPLFAPSTFLLASALELVAWVVCA